MSFQAMTWAVEQELPAMQKLALLMLANCCNHHTGQCNPSHDRLAKECGMGRSALKEALKGLREKGLLEVIHNVVDGVNLPNQYRLNFAVFFKSESDGVGRQTTEGRSPNDRGVGRQTATNQEVEPGSKPKDPPYPPEGGEDGPEDEKKPKRGAICLKTFLEACKLNAEKAIPDTDPVFSYAENTGIPIEFLRLHWLEFKSRYSQPDARRYKDWRSVYRKSVRGCWFKLWYLRADGECGLTTQGEQAKRHHGKDLT